MLGVVRIAFRAGASPLDCSQFISGGCKCPDVVLTRPMLTSPTFTYMYLKKLNSFLNSDYGKHQNAAECTY